MIPDPIPLSRPVLGGAEEGRVLDVLRSGRLSLGPLLAEFEAAFARRVGARFASGVSTGTAGLHLALRAVGVSEGDEVITSPFSFVSSANVALYERARPVFVDIDPVTLNLRPDAVAAAVTDRTAALLPVHVFGYPADVPALERLGLPIVEDACEALGAAFADGVPVGARGHPTVFGFYPNKQLTTGEGGMVCVVRAGGQGADRFRAQSGTLARTWAGSTTTGWGTTIASRRSPVRLGLAQLERLEALLTGRALVASLYREALASVDGLVLPCPDSGGARRGWFVFVVQLPRGCRPRLDRAGPGRPRDSEQDPTSRRST